MKSHMIAVALLTLSACGGDAVTSEASTRNVANAGVSFDVAYNNFRVRQGVVRMREDPKLTRAAQAHALDMERRGYFSHTAPNGSNFQSRAQAAGCNLRAGAENIAQGQRSESEVLNAWANSPGHRDNLIAPAYRVYGLGRSGNTWVMKLAASC